MNEIKEHELREYYETASPNYETVDDWVKAVADGIYYRSDIMALLAQRDQARADLTVSQQQTEKWIGKSLDIGKDLTNVRDTLQIIVRNLQEMTIERNKLAVTLNEWSEQYRKIISESCAPDELHCSCVPVLREEIGKLRAENEKLRKFADG